MIIVAHFDVELQQMDVKTNFLNENLEDEVYMTQPECLGDNSQKACKLRKSIYGLKTRLPPIAYKILQGY
jgi:uncharacterized Fe-S cluster-containing radical SAM superfamily enzyme